MAAEYRRYNNVNGITVQVQNFNVHTWILYIDPLHLSVDSRNDLYSFSIINKQKM